MKTWLKIFCSTVTAATFVWSANAAENMISLSLGDLYAIGRGDERVDSPERIESAVRQWKEMFDGKVVLWRIEDMHLDHFKTARSGYIGNHIAKVRQMRKQFDNHKAGREAAHKNGMKFYLNLSFNDGGWPEIADGCKVYYCYQDKELIAHPEYQEVDKRGVYHYGYLDLSNPAARKYMVERIAGYVKDLQADGLYLNSRSHSGVYSQDKRYKNGPHHADRFGFGKNLVAEYKKRYNIDITTDPRFDYQSKEFAPQSKEVENWRKLRGEYFLTFYKEVKAAIGDKKLILALPLGDYMGSSGGNIFVDHERIIKERIGDMLALGVSSGYVPVNMQRKLGYLTSEAHEANFNVPTFAQYCQKYGKLASENNIQFYTIQQFAYNKKIAEKIDRNPLHKGMMISHLSLQSLGIFSDSPSLRPQQGVFSVETVTMPLKTKYFGQLLSKYNHRDTESMQRGWSLTVTPDKKKQQLYVDFRVQVRWPLSKIKNPDKYPARDVNLRANVKVDYNQWCHIGGTVDMINSKLHIYVNGKKAGTADLPPGSYMHANTETDFCIGAYSGYRSVTYAGLIDYVRISHAPIPESDSIPDYTGQEPGTRLLFYFNNTDKPQVPLADSQFEFTRPPEFRAGRNNRMALYFSDEENKL